MGVCKDEECGPFPLWALASGSCCSEVRCGVDIWTFGKMGTQAEGFGREAYYADRNEGNGFAGEQRQTFSRPVTSVSFRRPILCNTIRAGSNWERCLP